MIFGILARVVFIALACSSLAVSPLAAEERFTVPPGFRVEPVFGGEAGSLVAMTFNHAGDLLVSREGGPLMLIRNPTGKPGEAKHSVYCDKVKNCQGMLDYLGDVYAVGDGPDGTGFYLLRDEDGDDVAEKVKTLFKFKGGMGEHGPHQPVVGPDGLIYLIIGNHAWYGSEPAPTSPHHHYYEGDLVQPRYEDANGHAVGIKTPGGTVIRCDRNGEHVELFCGGFRNAYDLALNRHGDFFTYDSDMEWDENLPWYRPTRVNHCIAGGEYGWRSGWAKWPEYFIDSLGAVVNTGRGSPTGVVIYDHTAFPEKYRGALFLADWSRGRVPVALLKPDGATYHGTEETFLEGKPLNVTDLDVGPDGALYFSVGGRDTEGGVFRVVWTGEKATPEVKDEGVWKAIHQPQLESAWARHDVFDVYERANFGFPLALLAVVKDTSVASEDRVRALDLIQRFGAAGGREILRRELSAFAQDANSPVRAKAAYLMGLHGNDATQQQLESLLEDPDATVRRIACESLIRAGYKPPVDKLTVMLGDSDHFVAWAAMRALQRQPVDAWQDAVLKSDNPRVFVLGSVGLLGLKPQRPAIDAVLDRARHWLTANLSDDDLLHVLRIVQVSLFQAGIEADQAPELRNQLAAQFPSADWRVNRELTRLLVHLQDPTLAPKLIAQLQGELPPVEKIHLAMHARFLQAGWTPELREGLLKFFESTSVLTGGHSFRGYLTNATNDFLKSGSAAEQLQRITAGAKTPSVTLQIVKNLPADLTAEHLAALRRLDRELANVDSPPARELAAAALAALGRAGDEPSLEYLHQVFESSPERRQQVAAAVSQFTLHRQRRPQDWPLLVHSLPVVEGQTARDVLQALSKLPSQNPTPEDVRQVILQGLKQPDNTGKDAVGLLEQWTRKMTPSPNGTLAEALASWQQWFRDTYPDLPNPSLPQLPEGAKWTLPQIVSALEGPIGRQASAERGTLVFEKAQCAKCHKFGPRGEGVGPDLTNVARRFQRQEIAESVLFPSQVISDQFAAKTVVTTDGRAITGLVGPTTDGVVVLQANAEKVNVAKAEIEEIMPSKASAMPAGLFDTLTQEEIADLFAYLAQSP